MIETACRRHLEPCRQWPGVSDVRVKGAIGVVELARPVDMPSITRRFIELMPPFIISGEDLEKLLVAMTGTIGEELVA